MRLKSIGYVYFVEAPTVGLVKIGFSAKHPDTRFSSLNVSSPVPLRRLGFLEGGREREREIHAEFRSRWSHGEWFALDETLAEFIRLHAPDWPPNPPQPRIPAGIRYGKAISFRKLAKERRREEQRVK